MKIICTYAPRRGRDGMATIIFTVLLAIMLILVVAESRSLEHLRREVRFMEQQQIKRLNGTPAGTTVITSTAETK